MITANNQANPTPQDIVKILISTATCLIVSQNATNNIQIQAPLSRPAQAPAPQAVKATAV